MMNNSSMSTNRNFIIAKPSNAFAHIINVFACHSHNNIIFYGLFLFLSLLCTYEADCFINKEIIGSIYLSIMNTLKAVFYIILFLKVMDSISPNRLYSTPCGQYSLNKHSIFFILSLDFCNYSINLFSQFCFPRYYFLYFCI